MKAPLVRAFAGVLLVIASCAYAQQALSPPLPGFSLTNEWSLRLGDAAATARIYHQGEQPAYLVFSDRLPGAVLLDLRSGMVESVAAGMIVRQRDGTLDVLPNARRRIGPFELARDKVTFVYEKKKAELVRNEAPASRRSN